MRLGRVGLWRLVAGGGSGGGGRFVAVVVGLWRLEESSVVSGG